MARFDTTTFDEVLFDTEGAGGGVPVDTSTIKIGTYVLQDASVFTSRFTYSAPRYELTSKAFPRADGAYEESAQFRETRLVLRGTLRKGTQTLLEQEMDNMRKAFARNTDLLFQWAGERRYWSVRPVGIDRLFEQREHYHMTWVPWEIELICLHPYARSAGRESFTGTNATTSPTTYVPSNGGTAPSESIVTLTIVTAGTLSEFSWENETTGETITINNGGAFSNGDTIIIDTESKTVTKNGTEIDYTGLLPHVDPGDNSCVFTALTGSGFTVAVSERHYKRYY